MAATVVLYGNSVADLLSSPSGAVAKDLTRRAVLVTNKAKSLCPVDGGRLRASITYQLAVSNGNLVARIGTNVEYALYVEEGTGIYGPRQAPIRPVHGQYLVFTPKGGSGAVFARSVRGSRAQPFLRPALAAAVA